MIKTLVLLLAIFNATSNFAATAITKYVGEWVPEKKYTPGQVVTRDQKTWLCVKECRVNTPGSNPTAWVVLGSDNSSSGGLRVYSANGSFLGFSATPTPSGGLIYNPDIKLFIELASPVYDSNDAPDISIANITGDIQLFDEYETEDCTGTPLAWATYSLEASKFLYLLDNKYVSIHPGVVYPDKSVVKGVKKTNANCNDGQWMQVQPTESQQCFHGGDSYVNVLEINYDPSMCAEHNLQSPCYQCWERTVVIPPGSRQKVTINPVTLPFAVPISLPLKFEEK